MSVTRSAASILVVKALFLFYCSVYQPILVSAYLPEEYEGVYIQVNKATNVLTVYLNGYPQFYFRVATGKAGADTPLGSFKVITKVKEPWYVTKGIPGGDPKNPLGTRWIGLNVPETNGYKYGIHGTNNPHSIGGYVSQGCIRMYNHDVEWLYKHIPKGTPVIIVEQAPR